MPPVMIQPGTGSRDCVLATQFTRHKDIQTSRQWQQQQQQHVANNNKLIIDDNSRNYEQIAYCFIVHNLYQNMYIPSQFDK